ncbi:MAG: hypothetical protein ACD_19C00021G0001, partial [uncultured bacterium]
GLGPVNFEAPEGIVTVEVDKISGKRAHDGFASRPEFFAKGSEPVEDDMHVNLKVCKSDGRLATPSDISGQNYDNKEYFVFKEEDPVSTDGKNRWQEAILNWTNGQSDSKYHPPTEYCGTTNPLSVEWTDPIDRISNLPNTFKIKIKATSTSNITMIEIYADGSKIRNIDSLPYEADITLNDGVHKLQVKAKDKDGHEKEHTITVGVNTVWDAGASPIP